MEVVHNQIQNPIVLSTSVQKQFEYQPSGAGGTRSPPATPHRLQRRTACNAAPPASGPQNGRQGLERCLPLGFGALPSTFSK